MKAKSGDVCLETRREKVKEKEENEDTRDPRSSKREETKRRERRPRSRWKETKRGRRPSRNPYKLGPIFEPFSPYSYRIRSRGAQFTKTILVRARIVCANTFAYEQSRTRTRIFFFNVCTSLYRKLKIFSLIRFDWFILHKKLSFAHMYLRNDCCGKTARYVFNK